MAGAAEDVGEAVAGAAEDAGEWIAGAAEAVPPVVRQGPHKGSAE